MKKLIAAIVILFSFLSISSGHSFAQKPDYEKYGRIAIAVVQADYPGDEVREYQYMGRTNIDGTAVMDSFRFQVREKNENFYVTVKIKHDLKNKKLINLTLETTKQ